MEFQHGGKRYLVSWQHFDDSAEVPHRFRDIVDGIAPSGRESVAEILKRLHELPAADQKERGVPFKVSRKINGQTVTYDGLTICRIRTPRDNADSLPPSERWETVVEGYAFKRSDDKSFNKAAGRKHSLTKALRGKAAIPVSADGRFDHETRTKIWDQFHLVWPPHAVGAGTLEKRYAKLRQELRALEQHTMDLMAHLKEANAAKQDA